MIDGNSARLAYAEAISNEIVATAIDCVVGARFFLTAQDIVRIERARDS